MTTTTIPRRVFTGLEPLARFLRIPACSTRPSAHTCSGAHLHLVREYRAAREAAEQAREDAVGVYGPASPEWIDYTATANMITFKSWLIALGGQRAQDQ